MRLEATRALTYAGKNISVGEQFDTTSDEDARLLKGFGKAKDIQSRDMKAEESKPAKVEQTKEKPVRKKRKYNRRDMRAKD